MRRLTFCVAVVAVVVGAGQTGAIEMVTVGNPGNSAHDDTGSGAVDYTYRIGKYEITAGQYTEFLNAVAATDTYELYKRSMGSHDYGCQIERTGTPGTYAYSVAPDYANRPVNLVSFWDAARFCNWLHNGQGSGDTETGAYINIGDQDNFARQPGAIYFIPTEDEWYKAAFHKNDGPTGNYFEYPTSSDSVPSHDLLTPDGGNNANFLDENGSTTIDSPVFRTEVGEFELSDSPYGTFDQAGNVGEWTETITEYGGRLVIGGSYASYANSLDAGSGFVGDPTFEEYNRGFRVASIVPEPGSFAMLAGLAVMGVLCWRRRANRA